MGIFDFFSNKKTETLENDVFIDMHSHYLPGIDDGSENIDITIEMLRQFEAMGYKKVIATPHIMGDFYQNTPEIISEKCEFVKSKLTSENIGLELQYAAEYYLDESFIRRINNREKLLTFGDNYVLFESSYINEPSQLKEVIFGLKAEGYKPVFAHPERYTYMYNSFKKYEEIFELNIYFQLNMLSLIGHYSPMAQKIAEKLIDANMISFIGTDAHHPRHFDGLNRSKRTKHYKKLLSQPILNNTL
jgi:protein-tyrosine phosphatase